MEAYYRLAYHLYKVSHNGGLPEALLARLKQKGQYCGVEHELYVASTFIKAGFTIEFEDESDSDRSHCEYTVTHVKMGRQFSVEAEARGVEATRLRRLLTDSLRKQADHSIQYRALRAAGRLDLSVLDPLQTTVLRTPIRPPAQIYDHIRKLRERQAAEVTISASLRGHRTLRCSEHEH